MVTRRKGSSGGASSSGHADSPSTRAGCSGSTSPWSAKQRVGNYDLENLSKKWDDDSVIRERIRNGFHLCRHWDHETKQETDTYVECCVDDARVNKLVVAPLLRLMKDNDLLLPSIDRLIQAICLFYEVGKKPRSLEHCYQQAWSLRRIIQNVKSHCYIDTPPQDRMLNCYMNCLFF